MYNKTIVDTLVADIYNDTYTKTEIDSTRSGYTNSIGLHNDFSQQSENEHYIRHLLQHNRNSSELL